MAYNLLALVARRIERAHRAAPEVSSFRLTGQVGSGYEGLMVARPPEHWSGPRIDIAGVSAGLLQLAKRITPKSIAVSQRGPKAKQPTGHVDGAGARTRVATARIAAKARPTA